QAANTCDGANPCLPLNVGFSSTINGTSAGFVCSNVAGPTYCLLGQATNGTTNGVNGMSSGGAGVFGITPANGANTGAVYGENTSAGASGVGVKGTAAGGGWAGRFDAQGASSYGVGAYGGNRGLDAGGNFYGAVGHSNSNATDAAGVIGTIT